MKKRLFTLVTTAGIVGILVGATSGGAVANDSNGPACVDIFLIGDDLGYRTQGTTATASGRVYTSAASSANACKSATYTAVISWTPLDADDPGSATFLFAGGPAGSVQTCDPIDGCYFAFEKTFTNVVVVGGVVIGAPSEVCIAASSTFNGRAVDRAPNDSCVEIDIDTGGGSSDWP